MSGKPNYPTMDQGGQQMYQASDGKWYPTNQMPSNWQGPSQQGGYGGYGQQQGQGQGYYGQQPMGYGSNQQQPYIVQQRPNNGPGAGAAAGVGCLAALCGTCLCLDCIF